MMPESLHDHFGWKRLPAEYRPKNGSGNLGDLERGRLKAWQLSVHHVGGRGGTGRFPIIPEFETDILNVLYEADETAIEAMKQEVSSLGSQHCIVNACLGQVEDKNKFYQLWNGSASSIFPVSPYFKTHYAYMTEDVLDYDAKAWEPIATPGHRHDKLRPAGRTKYANCASARFLVAKYAGL